MTARTIDARLLRLEAAQRAVLARNTSPRFLLQFHDAVDGRDAGVVYEVWFGGEPTESGPLPD